MAITLCTVSGNVSNLFGGAVEGCVVKVSVLTPFFHSGSGTWISGELESVTTDATGAFSVTVIETDSVGRKLTFSFDYYDGGSARKTKQYSVVIPATPTANLSDLVLDNNVPAGTDPFPARYVSIIPAITNLTATNAQAAFTEHQADIDGLLAQSDGTIRIGAATGVATERTISGDVTISDTGVADISAGVITNTEVSASAAIARSKIAVGTAQQVVVNDGTGALSGITPGTSGNILTSDGTTWTSAPSSSGTPITTLDEGVSLTTNTSSLDFVGAGVTASATLGAVTVTIPTTTASNIGTGGVGVYKQKTAANLELKNIGAGSSKITITDNTGANRVDVDVAESALTHNNIGGTLNTTKGGTGQDLSASTGVVKVASGVVSAATVVNADVSGSAAIAYSKLALTGSVVDADIVGVAGSKVSGDIAGNAANVTGVVATSKGGTGQNLSAATGVVKMAAGVGSASTIVNADVAAAAAIARTKIANGTASHVVINDGSGTLSSVAALTVANGGTGLATLTANSVVLGNGTSTPTFVAPGSNGNVLTSNGTTWTSAAAGASSIPAMAVYTTAAGQTCTTSAYTIINYGTLEIDNGATAGSGSAFVTTGASWKFTANRAMNVVVSAAILFNNTAANGSLYLVVYKNGSAAFKLFAQETSNTTNSKSITMTGSRLMALATSDYIDVRAFQNTGTTTLVAAADSNWISITEVK